MNRASPLPISHYTYILCFILSSLWWNIAWAQHQILLKVHIACTYTLSLLCCNLWLYMLMCCGEERENVPNGCCCMCCFHSPDSGIFVGLVTINMCKRNWPWNHTHTEPWPWEQCVTPKATGLRTWYDVVTWPAIYSHVTDHMIVAWMTLHVSCAIFISWWLFWLSAVHKAPLQEEEIQAICYGTLMVSHMTFPSLSSLSELHNSTNCCAMATVRFASTNFLYPSLSLSLSPPPPPPGFILPSF